MQVEVSVDEKILDHEEHVVHTECGLLDAGDDFVNTVGELVRLKLETGALQSVHRQG